MDLSSVCLFLIVQFICQVNTYGRKVGMSCFLGRLSGLFQKGDHVFLSSIIVSQYTHTLLCPCCSRLTVSQDNIYGKYDI